MSEIELGSSAAFEQGKRDPLIEHFGIVGLYGYRSISLSSAYAATILIAKNGSGKTTLLGALDAVLRRQFFRLRDLDFREIHCKFKGSKEVILLHEDIEKIWEIPGEGEIVKLSGRTGISPTKLFSFIVDEWQQLKDSAHYMDDPTFSEIMRSVEFSYPRAAKVCDQLFEELWARSPRLKEVSREIMSNMQACEVVYLPTYRRVELALRRDTEESSRRRKKPRFDVAAGSLFTGEIQFGLSDIAEKLAEMNNRIVRQSNAGYREISANIINELIDGSFEQDPDSDREIPTPEELRLFFSRLGERSQTRAFAPFYGAVSAPNFEKVYSGDVPADSLKFLNYFLRKLGKVIEATRDIERSVEDFVSSCNKYLLSEETSTILYSNLSHVPSVDGKVMRLDRQKLMVHVESVPGGRQIALDALSSGEKQMVSLFAKMFLYEGQKIVLIDEPELSLSIDWQREILVDVLKAPLCRQMIAITHSPFVFDNALEPFAKSLYLNDEHSVGQS